MVLSAALLMALLAMACKPREVTGDNSPRGTGAEVLQRYQQHLLDYRTLSLKGKGTYDNPTDKQNFTFTYRINVLRDSLIWASISKFGIEGMRMLANRDSVWVRRMDAQEGIRCDLGYLREATGMDVDFAGLQSFLVGELVGSPSSLRYVDGSKNPYQYLGTLSGYQVKWEIDGRSHKVVKATAQEPILQKQSTFSWGEFKPVGNSTFAHMLTVDVTAPKAMRFEMSHSNVAINEENVNFNFSFPDNYAIKNCMEASGGK
jgi:hypothetical protein